MPRETGEAMRPGIRRNGAPGAGAVGRARRRWPRVITQLGLLGVLTAGAAALSAQTRALELPPAAATLDRSAVGGQAAVRPGDQVQVIAWNEPEINGVYLVTERGEVVLPRLGTVSVHERPIVGVQDSLRAALAEYLRNPAIQVRVLRRILVVGEVRSPGLYMADLTMSAREAIAAAGGLTPDANRNHIVLVRGGERVRLNTRAGVTLDLHELRSGDEIVVGRRSWMAANPLGFVSTVVGLVSLVVAVAR
jgi:polysaccharide biosynthesis/export protein